MLNGTKLTKIYNGREVLKEVNIKIVPGKITSLIGPSGSGKTTLLRVLSMLDLPESGNISFNNEKYEQEQCDEIGRMLCGLSRSLKL